MEQRSLIEFELNKLLNKQEAQRKKGRLNASRVSEYHLIKLIRRAFCCELI